MTTVNAPLTESKPKSRLALALDQPQHLYNRDGSAVPQATVDSRKTPKS
jgi:hypothetical protein